MLPIKRLNSTSVLIQNKDGIEMLFPGESANYKGKFPLTTRLDVFRPIQEEVANKLLLIPFSNTAYAEWVVRSIAALLVGYRYEPKLGLFHKEGCEAIKLDEIRYGENTGLNKELAELHSKLGVDFSFDSPKLYLSALYPLRVTKVVKCYRERLNEMNYRAHSFYNETILIKGGFSNVYYKMAKKGDVLLITGAKGGIRTIVEVTSTNFIEHNNEYVITFKDYGKNYRNDGELFVTNLTSFLKVVGGVESSKTLSSDGFKQQAKLF